MLPAMHLMQQKARRTGLLLAGAVGREEVGAFWDAHCTFLWHSATCVLHHKVQHGGSCSLLKRLQQKACVKTSRVGSQHIMYCAAPPGHRFTPRMAKVIRSFHHYPASHGATLG